MRRRLGHGAAWSLPVAIALERNIRGASGLLIAFAVLTALLGFVPGRRLRLWLRLGLLAAGLAWAVGGAHGLHWPGLHRLLGEVAALTPQNVGTRAASAAFLVAATALAFAFEAGGGALLARLAQVVLGGAVLGQVAAYGGAVQDPAVAFAAAFVPVRLLDQAPPGAWSGWGLPAFAAAACALAIALGARVGAPPARAAGGVGVAAGVRQGYPLQVGRLDVPVSRSGRVAFVAGNRGPLYWQVFTSYRYTGQGWQPPGAWRSVGSGREVVRPGAGARLLIERVTLRGAMASDPVAGEVVAVLRPRATWSYAAASGAYAAPGRTVELLAELPAAALPSAGAVAVGRRGAPRAALSLPRSLPGAVRRLAARIVRGAPRTVAGEARAIEDYLDAHERYTLRVPSDGGRDFVYDFLFVHHAGDCNSFSTAFVVLARSVGIPARWVAGYLPGRLEAQGRLVTAADAHSWAEVWVDGLGWLPVDPTPGFALPSPQAPSPAAERTTTSPGSARGASASAEALRALQGLRGSGGAPGGPARARPATLGWAGALVLAGLVLAALHWRRETGIALWRGAGRLAGRPWPRRSTVREWLRGDAPALRAYLEWRLYLCEGSPPVALRSALGDLVALRSGGR